MNPYHVTQVPDNVVVRLVSVYGPHKSPTELLNRAFELNSRTLPHCAVEQRNHVYSVPTYLHRQTNILFILQYSMNHCNYCLTKTKYCNCFSSHQLTIINTRYTFRMFLTCLALPYFYTNVISKYSNTTFLEFNNIILVTNSE